MNVQVIMGKLTSMVMNFKDPDVPVESLHSCHCQITEPMMWNEVS